MASDPQPLTVLKSASDWDQWKFDVKSKLRAKNCYAAIDPFPFRPTGSYEDDEDKRAKYTEKDLSAAYGFLIPLIDRPLRKIFNVNEDDPRVIIQCLYDFFFVDTGANLVTLTSEFNGQRLLPNEQVLQFAGRINVLRDQMAAHKGEPTQVQLISVFLEGLPNDDWLIFKQQINAAENISGKVATYEQLCQSAAKFESTIQRSKKDKALMSRPGPNAKPERPTCGRCKKVGHISDKCWDTECVKPPPGRGQRNKPLGQSQPPNSKPPPSPCDCGELHWRRDCPRKKSNTALLANHHQPIKNLVLDSGATKHVIKDADLLTNTKPINASMTGLGGQQVAVTATGTLHGFPGEAQLVPDSQENLVSIFQLAKHGWTTTFEGNSLRVVLASPEGRKIMGTLYTGNLYRIDETCYIATDDERHAANMYDTHCKFGHARGARLLSTAKTYGIDTSHWPKELPYCKACVEGKSKRARISRQPRDTNDQQRPAPAPGARLHVDLMGPLDGGYYVLDAVDEATRYEIYELIRNKSNSALAMAKAIDDNYTPLQSDPEEIHSDRGGEFVGKDWLDMCKERGIRVSYAATATPEHNGLAERTHGTTTECARTLLAAANLDPAKFYRQAYDHAVFLHNISTTRSLPDGKTPYELWHGRPARIDNLLPFGTRILYHTTDNAKFGKRAAPGIYLGPAPNTVGGAIRVYTLETQREIVTRSYNIDKPGLRIGDYEPLPQRPVTTDKQIPNLVDDSDSEDEGIDDNLPRETTAAKPAVGARELKSLGRIDDASFGDRIRETRTRSQGRTAQGEEQAGQALLATSGAEPMTYKQAMLREDAPAWRDALSEELNNLLQRQVFDIVPSNQQRRPIRSRWVFKYKTNENNEVIRHKARLVACGYSQVPGIDYFNVSAPVATKESCRTLFAVAAQKGYRLIQFDFDQAYVNADLDTEIYMLPPDGFLDLAGDTLSPDDRARLSSGDAILRVNKALYGLKQSGRRWYETLRDDLIEFGLKPCESDPCIFFGNGIIVIIYVDDGIIMADTQEAADAFYKLLEQRFRIKYLGRPSYFNGLAIEYRSDGSIFVQQRGYALAVGENYADGMHPKTTPMAYGAALDPESPSGDKKLYAEMIGTLLYAAVSTRPDIACPVSMLSRYMQEPSKAQVTHARNIASYLANTADFGLLYKSAPDLKLEVFCDASFAPDETQRRSRSGWIVMLNGTPVSWKSSLQPLVAHSTAEAEYIALSDAVRDATFVHRLLQELSLATSGPITVYEDNNTTIVMANEIATKRSKYIDVRYHHVRALVASGQVNIVYCPTADMLADALTKALPKDRFCTLRDRFMAKGE